MHLRTRSGALGAVAALTLAVAGCGDGDGTSDPNHRLTSSADALTEESFKIEMTLGEAMATNGAFDPDAGTSELTMVLGGGGAMSMEIKIISTETDMWLNMGEFGAMLGAEQGWMHVDLGRLGPEGLMGVEPGGGDPASAWDMLQTASEVEQVDDHTFEGVVDLTQNAPEAFDAEALAALDEDMTSVQFTATIDDQDRLNQLVIMLPDMPEMEGSSSLEIRYYDYGAPVEITEPPADQVSPMPEMLYELFGQM